MAFRPRARVLALFGTALTFLLISCATGPRPPQKGTPAFYWEAANETYAAGDYRRTNDHLEQISKPGSEYASRALPWRLVLAAGLAQGYSELASSFQAGGRVNKTNPTPFRRQADEFFTRANRFSLQFAEAYLAFEKQSKDPAIMLVFTFPRGTAARAVPLANVESGIMVSETDILNAESQMVQRGVLLAACRAAGAEEDPAKAQAAYGASEAKVPRETFIYAMAKTLHELSELYGPYKLYQPNRIELFCNEALEALKTIPETKETKELAKKIETSLKEAKKGR